MFLYFSTVSFTLYTLTKNFSNIRIPSVDSIYTKGYFLALLQFIFFFWLCLKQRTQMGDRGTHEKPGPSSNWPGSRKISYPVAGTLKNKYKTFWNFALFDFAVWMFSINFVLKNDLQYNNVSIAYTALCNYVYIFSVYSTN